MFKPAMDVVGGDIGVVPTDEAQGLAVVPLGAVEAHGLAGAAAGLATALVGLRGWEYCVEDGDRVWKLVRSGVTVLNDD